MASTPFTLQERDALVKGYAEALDEIHQLELDVEKPGGATEASYQRLSALSERLVRLAEEYRDRLPRLPLSRCPFTGAEVRHSFDPYDFTGMWWQRDDPIRPDDEPEAGQFFLALSGAVRISEPVEHTQFLVVPGPGLPFVIPRVLELPQVRAVLSYAPIGRHHGFSVAYFASAPLEGVRPPTLWGTDWTVIDPSRRDPDDDLPDMEEDFDYDLEPWIRARKLSWIAPNDRTLTLRLDVAGCPYLGLTGDRHVQRVHYGETWSD